MTDEIFWDSSPRFLFNQLDIHRKNIEESNKRSKSKVNNKNENIGEKTRLKVLSKKEIDEIMKKNK